jgi:hypothetical protein
MLPLLGTICCSLGGSLEHAGGWHYRAIPEIPGAKKLKAPFKKAEPP